jgi:Ni/Co efflux regulator RcnB
MKMRWWAALCVSAVFALTGSAACAQGNSQGHGHGQDQDEGHGHGHGHGKDHHGEDRDHRGWYSQHDRDELRVWYRERQDDGDLPPGLAKRDELPPGLERQLRIRGELPPGLRRKMRPCPPELVRELPPPPPDCEHVVIGGNIVLWNRRTNIVLDVVAFAHF